MCILINEFDSENDKNCKIELVKFTLTMKFCTVMMT